MVKVLDYKDYNELEVKASFSAGNRLYRLVWAITWCLLASWTPPALAGWRRWLLILFGAKVGHRSEIRGSVKVWAPVNLVMEDYVLIAQDVTCYNQARITLKRGSLVSQGAHLCCGTHDIYGSNFQLIAKEIVIGEGAWVAAEAFVGPGVTIGRRAVLGARGVAFKDLEENGIYVGNPAKLLKYRAPEAAK